MSCTPSELESTTFFVVDSCLILKGDWMDAYKKYANIASTLIPTGVLALDIVMGGGYLQGDTIEVYSPSGCGKSTMMLAFCRNQIKLGRKVLYCDVERGVKSSILIGTNLDKYVNNEFQHVSPVTWEQLEEILDAFLKDNERELCVLDSITATMPGKLEGKSVQDIEIGLDARIQGAFFRKYKPMFIAKGKTLFFINQVRMKIDISYGGKTEMDSAGGNACKFYSDVRVALTQGATMKRVEQTVLGEKDVIFGNMAYISTKKNRFERPEIRIPIPIIFGRGVSNILTLTDILRAREVITGGGGGHFKVTGLGFDEKVRGKKEMNQWVKEHYTELHDKAKEAGFFNLTSGEES